MVKIQCAGRIEVAMLKRERNELRDAHVVKNLKRLFPHLKYKQDKWLLVAFDLWNMYHEATSQAFCEIVDRELNDNEACPTLSL